MAETDSSSLKKVQATRPDLAEDLSRFHNIPRSREALRVSKEHLERQVGQSWASTVFTTAQVSPFVFIIFYQFVILFGGF